jgi:curved DNA-binding protein CbpA
VDLLDSTVDYYSLLGVKWGASPAEIKNAFRRMVFQYHPDRNPNDKAAAEKLRHVLEAYGVLSDSAKRTVYDRETRPASEAEAQQSEEQFGNHVGTGFEHSHDFQQKTAPEPKCPQCSAVGIDQIVSRKGGAGTSKGKQFVLSPFNIIFCGACGHVYGVTAQSS